WRRSRILDTFHDLLAPVIGDASRALPLLSEALDLGRALAAIRRHELVGICGMQHRGRHFVALNVRPLLRAFGVIDGLRRIAIGGLLDHQASRGELIIDGIAVLASARGLGIGALLLGELERFAREHGLSTLRLDVVSDNHNAHRLYRRCGFIDGMTSRSWLRRRAFGIESVTTMSKSLTSTIFRQP
ncbi:MAG TPA: GNAT family N-acetyltransferase, partial [Nannocystis exedens]|nr:GNAT family N-acetyltransferase [Nannocystis exedens]